MAVILIVDDVKTNRMLLGKVVVESGHVAEYAEDGAEALPRAQAVKPSLIFMDMVMQTTNGVDACRQLKATPETAHIPVVLLPSRAPGQDESWAQKLGADDHLAKPFAPDEVMSVIRRYVG